MHYAKYVWPEMMNEEMGLAEFPEPWLLAHVPEMGGVALDVGANVGLWARLLAGRFDTVYAMEPQSVLHDLLRAIPGVALVPFGAWRIDGECEFTRYVESVHLSMRFCEGGGIGAGVPMGSTMLPVRRIDCLAICEAVDFLKVDVEGAEAEVLEGAWRLLEYDRPVVLVEIHSATARRHVEGIFGTLAYGVEVVRHPYYAEGSEMWERHLWLVARPHERGG